MWSKRGLRGVSTAHLRHLLKVLHREELECPLDRRGLAAVGLLHTADDLDHLRGLDKAAVVAVLTAVLHERVG